VLVAPDADVAEAVLNATHDNLRCHKVQSAA
jgi:hypothetical protein